MFIGTECDLMSRCFLGRDQFASGVNIAGTDYNTWVAGYATTTSVTLDTESQWNSTTVSASITATQSDGGSTSYQGTYTVEGGVITSANITQTG